MSSSNSRAPKLSPERVREIAWRRGYQEIILVARDQGHKLSFEHHSKPGCGGPDQEYGRVRIDVHFTTGKVTTSLNHPTGGKNPLQRDVEQDYSLLEKIFVNPRYHTDTGYHTREVGEGEGGSEIIAVLIITHHCPGEEEAGGATRDSPGFSV